MLPVGPKLHITLRPRDGSTLDFSDQAKTPPLATIKQNMGRTFISPNRTRVKNSPHFVPKSEKRMVAEKKLKLDPSSTLISPINFPSTLKSTTKMRSKFN